MPACPFPPDAFQNTLPCQRQSISPETGEAVERLRQSHTHAGSARPAVPVRGRADDAARLEQRLTDGEIRVVVPVVVREARRPRVPQRPRRGRPCGGGAQQREGTGQRKDERRRADVCRSRSVRSRVPHRSVLSPGAPAGWRAARRPPGDPAKGSSARPASAPPHMAGRSVSSAAIVRLLVEAVKMPGPIMGED